MHKQPIREAQRLLHEVGLSDGQGSFRNSSASLGGKSGPALLLIMNIDIDEADKDQLHIYEDSDPHELALRFCRKHGLSAEYTEVIEEQIVSNLEKILEEQTRTLDMTRERTRSIGASDFSRRHKDESTFERSRPMSGGSDNNVFNRLHHDSIVKTKRRGMEGVRSLSQGKKANNRSLDYSSMKSSSGRGLEDEKEATFQPKINEISKRIMADRDRSAVLHELVGQRKGLSFPAEIREEEEFAFRPEINEISNKIVEEKARMRQEYSGDKFEELHQDWKYKQAKMKAMAIEATRSECSFYPQINEISRRIVANQENEGFLDRMAKYSEQKKYKIKEAPQEELSHDPMTGQRLFQPMIKRGPLVEKRNAEGLPIGEFLYNTRFEKVRAQHAALTKEKERIEQGKSKITEKSAQIVEMARQQRLREIFTLFDSDEDGLVSANHIDISHVPTPILEIFAPFLTEMEELNIVLDLQTFLEAAHKLVQNLSTGERDKLFGLYKSMKKTSPQCTFQPMINQRSEKLALRQRPYGQPDLYDHYLQEEQMRKEKLREIRVEKELRELDECSFKPQLVTKKYFERRGIKI